MAVEIDRLDRVRLQEGGDRLLVLGAAALPVRAAQAFPCGGEADLESIGVLDDQPFQPIGMLVEDAEADGPTVVLDIHAELREADLLQEFLDDLGRLVEGVGELLGVRNVGIAETRIVRRHDVKFVGQRVIRLRY